MHRFGPLLLALALAACNAAEPPPPAPSTAPGQPATAAPTIRPLAAPGTEIAFVAGADPQIHLLDLGTGESRQLTNLGPEDAELSAAPAMLPVLSCGFGPSGLTWSPDGALLAFSYGGCDTVVHVVDVEGNLRRIGDGRGPSWSSDGRQLIFGANHPWCPSGRPSDCGRPGAPDAWNLRVAEIGGGPAATVPGEDTGGGSQPSFSPDGRLIAFAGSMPDTGDNDGLFSAVYVVDSDGSARRLVARGAWPAGWALDGRLLIVDERSSDLLAIDLRTADVERLGGDAGPGSAAPDASAHLFTRTDPATGTLSVQVTTADGTIVAEYPSAFPAGWAPDGSAGLVFTGDVPTLVVVGPDGGEQETHELPGSVPFGGAAWRPAP